MARAAHAVDITGASDRQYRRGALLGLTMAEIFVLIAFALLLLLAAWKTEVDREARELQAFDGLGPAERAILLKIAESGHADLAAEIVEWDQLNAVEELIRGERDLEVLNKIAASEDFEVVQALIEQGSDLQRLQDIATDGERWRLIDQDELRRILDGAQELPEDLQRDLADLVELREPQEVMRLLEMTKRAPDNVELRERLAGIGAKLDEARRAEGELVADLRATLGDVVSRIGGHITDEGDIVLPDTVLFELGSAEITETMQAFLDRACLPWMEVMMRSPIAVAGAQIEGHASSEWRADTAASEAYLNNLDLSQRRSQSVLRTCLTMASVPGVEDWAREHLVAVGFSSARPILFEGAEDRAKSRRVVFSIDVDRSRVLTDVESEVDETLSTTGN